MRSKLSVILLVLAMASTWIISVSGANQNIKGVGESIIPVTVSKIENESAYKEFLNTTWSQYMDDLNYSSVILSGFVKKNLTNREAMISTTSLFVLTAQTDSAMDNVKPIQKYSNSHNDTLQALSNLEGYLWNIAKFYETDNTIYAIKARSDFNKSLSFYEKAHEEFKLNK